MLKVYSESLMELQDWFKNVDTRANRGWVYSVVADAMILLSLKVLEAIYSQEEIKRRFFDDIVNELRFKHRVLEETIVYDDVMNVLVLLLEERKPLIYKLGKEILETSEHGVDLKYNIVDLVACRYWFTDKPNNLLAGNQ